MCVCVIRRPVGGEALGAWGLEVEGGQHKDVPCRIWVQLGTTPFCYTEVTATLSRLQCAWWRLILAQFGHPYTLFFRGRAGPNIPKIVQQMFFVEQWPFGGSRWVQNTPTGCGNNSPTRQAPFWYKEVCFFFWVSTLWQVIGIVVDVDRTLGAWLLCLKTYLPG